jgi:hypothetical protein
MQTRTEKTWIVVVRHPGESKVVEEVKVACYGGWRATFTAITTVRILVLEYPRVHRKKLIGINRQFTGHGKG